MARQCSVCGGEMKAPKDYAMGNISKSHCTRCEEEKSFVKTYERKIKSFALFIVKAQGTTEKKVRSLLSKAPAARKHRRLNV